MIRYIMFFRLFTFRKSEFASVCFSFRYCALIAYIIFEGPEEDRNMNTLVDMISGMEVKEDDDEFSFVPLFTVLFVVERG